MLSPNQLIKKYLNQYIFIINLSSIFLEIQLFADLFYFQFPLNFVKTINFPTIRPRVQTSSPVGK